MALPLALKSQWCNAIKLYSFLKTQATMFSEGHCAEIQSPNFYLSGGLDNFQVL